MGIGPGNQIVMELEVLGCREHLWDEVEKMTCTGRKIIECQDA